MLRLLKYFKPFRLLILLAIALLFVQANADLALPDYLSKIVNIGIQSGGIQNGFPQAIRQSQMNRLTIFLSADDKARVLKDYTLIDPSSPDYTKYLAQYPALKDGPIYVVNNLDQAETDWLNPVMAKNLLIVYGIEQFIANPSKAAAAGQSTGQSMSQCLPSGVDLSKIPQNVDPFALLGQMPASAIAQLTSCISQPITAMGSSALIQASAIPIQAEYSALGMDPSSLSNHYILSTGGLMLLLTLLSVTCTIIVGFLSARIAAGLARNLRKYVFTKVESFSNAEFDKFSTASLITRSTNDITQIQMVVLMMVRMVFYAPIIGVGGIIRALGKDTSMWWIIALAVAILIVLILVVYNVAVPKFKIVQKLTDRLNLVTRENLSGMMVIRAFNRQDSELERFDKANLDLTSTNLFINRVMVVMMPVMMFIMNCVSILIIWIGSHQVAQANMQVGDMIAFMQYAMQILFAFLMLSFMFIILPRAQVSGDRIADVLETEPSIRDPERPQALPENGRGMLEFQHVSFRYPNAEEDVLHDITFTARPGQTTAFIGPTGSGKSTVVSLIPRFYDVTEGSILVDGVDVRNVTQHDLRARIGYVPQKSSLFSGTIESNLRYADESAPDEVVEEAVHIAQAEAFIKAKPEGMDEPIAQGGANVSGGQKQRLSIARALVKQAPINIFDDSFSALDFKTDSALRRALKEHSAGSTVLLVTQRVATVKAADQIIVLDEGRVVGKGTHQDLMKTCQTYKEIALSQLSMEELS
jgi:ATP-binding cassette subfamily B multidrug efflux pump